MERVLRIKCPHCRTNKNILAGETIEATTEFTFKDGICVDTNNEYGVAVRPVYFKCNNCGHYWVGRKGVTIDQYSEVV